MSVIPLLINLSSNEVIEINSKKFSVGRSLNNDYILNCAFASRVQFILENVDEVWTIQDKSTNGTLLNNLRIKNGERVKIAHGDLLNFQNVQIQLRVELPQKASNNNISCVAENVPENSERSSDCEITQISVGTKRSITSEAKCPDNVAEKNTQKKIKLSENNTLDDKKETAESLRSIEEEFHCSICSELFIKAVTLNCCHTFCSFCINHWKKKHPICPICRKNIVVMAPTLVLDNYIEKLVDRMDDEAKQQRKESIKERTEAINPPQTTNVTTSIVVSSDDDSAEEDTSEDGADWSFEEIIELPGAGGYYGGYGRCFRCNGRGHWANQCPYY